MHALRELYEETGMRTVELIQELPDWLFYDLAAPLARRSLGRALPRPEAALVRCPLHWPRLVK